jgi:hypothetical protein
MLKAKHERESETKVASKLQGEAPHETEAKLRNHQRKINWETVMKRGITDKKLN